jgi:hypothetical protein
MASPLLFRQALRRLATRTVSSAEARDDSRASGALDTLDGGQSSRAKLLISVFRYLLKSRNRGAGGRCRGWPHLAKEMGCPKSIEHVGVQEGARQESDAIRLRRRRLKARVKVFGLRHLDD